MENNILQHRLAVQQNISKAFENDFDVDIEKGKWQVGMTKQYQGKTYKVGGFNASGNPLWRLVKNDNGGGNSDGGGSKQQTDDSNKKVPDYMKSYKIISVNGIDKQEYDRIYEMTSKQLGTGKREDEDAIYMGLGIIKNNLSGAENKLDDLKKNRPGAKAAIQSYEKEVVKFKSQLKAAEDALKDYKQSNKKPQQQQGSSFKNTVKMSEKDFDDSVNKNFKIVNQDGLKLVYDNNKHIATYNKKTGQMFSNDDSWKVTRSDDSKQQKQQQNAKQVFSQKDYDAQKNLWSEIASNMDSVEEIEGKIKEVEKELLKLVNSTDNVKIETLQAQRDGCMEGVLKFKNKVRKRIEALENQKKEIDDDIAKLKKQLGGGNTTQNTTAKTQPKTTVSPQTNKPKTTVSDLPEPIINFASNLEKESKLYVLKYDSYVDGVQLNKEMSGKDAADLFLNARSPQNIRFFKDEKDYKNAIRLINKISSEYTGKSGQDYSVIDRLSSDLDDVEKKALKLKRWRFVNNK